MNVWDYVTEAPEHDKGINFWVDGDRMYPDMIDHIQEILFMGARGRDFLDKAGYTGTAIEKQYWRQAGRLPPSVWQMAKEAPVENMNPEHRQRRAEALTLARLWFTEMLHHAVNYEYLPFRIKSGPHKTFRP